MASHVRSKPSRFPRALLRAGLVVSAAGAALAAGGAAGAQAAPTPSADNSGGRAAALADAVLDTAGGSIATAKNLQLNPLANTPVDPLSNSVGTQIADFKPVSTAAATGPLSEGAALKDLPVVGEATQALPG
ncbi:hypothetical protein QOM21_14045 [Streptomyces sp. Pv4-95]|uniref:hypothetical protein n=1 Tax=Streptomyces sp. Pv4-95 TaxID=3049543 RepID=UPI00389277E0